MENNTANKIPNESELAKSLLKQLSSLELMIEVAPALIECVFPKIKEHDPETYYALKKQFRSLLGRMEIEVAGSSKLRKAFETMT